MKSSKYKLGRIPSLFDSRNYQLKDYLPILRLSFKQSMRWEFPHTTLDQKQTGHCVGFSMADWGISSPINDKFDNQAAHNFYYACKVVDKEPRKENGSSIHTAAKVLSQKRMLKTYAFASNVNEIKYWVLNSSPMIVGTDWTESMFSPDVNGLIKPVGAAVGGHAYLIDEVTSGGFFGIRNSWGSKWGLGGRAYIKISDFALLFKHGGEALAAIETK